MRMNPVPRYSDRLYGGTSVPAWLLHKKIVVLTPSALFYEFDSRRRVSKKLSILSIA